MVREESANAVDRLALSGNARIPAAAPSAESTVEHWLRHLRLRLPPDAFVTATIQAKAQYGFLASFRVRIGGQTVSSEARSVTAERAVEEAGRGLCEHLPADAFVDESSSWQNAS